MWRLLMDNTDMKFTYISYIYELERKVRHVDLSILHLVQDFH